MHPPTFTNTISFWGVGSILLSLIITTLVMKRATVVAAQETAAAWERRANLLQTQLDEEKKQRRKFERRLIALEADQAKAELRHKFDQGEKDRYQQIIHLAWKVIEPQANGSKAKIEEGFRELAGYQTAMRDQIADLEETQRLFRTYKDDEKDE